MASRVCVKNLPKQCTDQQLRSHFSEKGEVTDAKVIHTKDGQSRQFGFVGFRTPEQAQDAIDYFNRTFLGAARLSVEFAEQVGAGSLSRPWSKYSKGSSAHAALNPSLQDSKAVSGKRKRPTESNAGEAADNPELAEFLQIMQPRRKTAMWANDDLIASSAPARKASAAAKQSKQQEGTKGSTDAAEGVSDKPSKRQRQSQAAAQNADASGNSSGTAHGDGEDASSGGDSMLHEDAAGGHQPSAEADADDEIVNNEEIDDLAYLKSRMRKQTSAAEEAKEDATAPVEPDKRHVHAADGNDSDASVSNDDELEAAEQDEAADSVDEDAETDMDRQQSHRAASTSTSTPAGGEEEEGMKAPGRLFLRNLPYTATEADIADLMGEYGQLSEVHLVLDKVTKKSRGIALVTFEDAQPAEAARAALDGSFFQGRLLHVLPARPPPAVVVHPPQEGKQEKEGLGGYKGEKEAKQRSQAGNRAAWNTLFMRADTVAEAIAAHLGMPKAQLLDRDAADLPVRMALGEAHVINLTKQSLGAAGVSIEALEGAAERSGKGASSSTVGRSPTTLIIKNLPYSAEEAELQELFGGCGVIRRLVLAPTKTLAIVEYSEASEARQAFRTLTFKRYHHVPIYLEWAPANIFSAAAPVQDNGGKASSGKAEAAAEQAAEEQPLPVAEDTAAESCTLYIKNLAFASDEKGLQGLCDPVVSAAGGSVRSVKVARHRGPNGRLLSAGFGFVECSSEQAARAALKKLQGSILDGHKLSIQLSMRKVEGDAAAKTSKAKAKGSDAAKEPSTKLVVRNVAFEATRKDIQQLFGPFGQLKSCRLPRKFDGNHRGFAFVDFVTKQEAKNSMEAVAGTHLYGRRLVVEWAEPDATLEDLRAKTAAKFQS